MATPDKPTVPESPPTSVSTSDTPPPSRPFKAAASAVFDRIAREPVLFFRAVELWVIAEFIDDPSAPSGIALAATILFLQRAFSTSKRAADENVEVAKYVAAVETIAAPAQSDAG